MNTFNFQLPDLASEQPADFNQSLSLIDATCGDPKKALKRPPNAFFVYRSMVLDDLRKEFPQLNSVEWSKILGQRWKNLSKEEKELYFLIAENGRKEHKKMLKKSKRLKSFSSTAPAATCYTPNTSSICPPPMIPVTTVTANLNPIYYSFQPTLVGEAFIWQPMPVTLGTVSMPGPFYVEGIQNSMDPTFDFLSPTYSNKRYLEPYF